MSKKSQIISKVKCLCFFKVIYLILIFSCKRDGAEPLCKYLYSSYHLEPDMLVLSQRRCNPGTNPIQINLFREHITEDIPY